MRRHIVIYRPVVLGLLAAIATPAISQESTREKEMEAIRAYCKPDIERLCPSVEPGEGRLKECLMKHKEQMSVGCAQALQELKKQK
jgi:hypothetical protein